MSLKTQLMGVANSSQRANEASRPEETALNVSGAFDRGDDWIGSIVGADPGPPYAVKGAAHAHDRIEERTNLGRNNVEPIQRAVDFLGLEPGSYHVPLRGKDGQILGYAQFKGVSNRKGPVLATVLAPTMVPGGINLETKFLKKAVYGTNVSARSRGLFDTDNLQPLPPEALGWNGVHATVGRQEDTPYAIDRGFNNATQAISGEVMENVGK